MGEGPIFGTFKISSLTMFIAENERSLVNSPMEPSNTLLVNGAPVASQAA